MAEEAIQKPVCVVVPEIELRNLCKLARESGEDLQAAARREYPDKSPSSVRRLNRDLSWAQMVIEAAAVVENILPENSQSDRIAACPSTTFDAETENCLLCGQRH